MGLMKWLVMTGCVLAGAGASALWTCDFEDVEVGSEPEGVIVLQGEFSVARDGVNNVLELPGAPLETMGILVGPSRREGVAITARVWGERKGRQAPSFGVGLCGARGYRLMISPMRDALELVREEGVVGRVEYEWKPGGWTHLRLSVEKTAESQWTVRGKAWPRGEPEPQSWAVESRVDEQPPSGGASLWGVPYSAKPIRYDDVVYDEPRP